MTTLQHNTLQPVKQTLNLPTQLETASKAQQQHPSRNIFSKVADMKIPDSPPNEKADEVDESQLPPGSKPGMSKFEQLMKAAVSIKSAQLDQKKKRFEKLPTFLKAGVYYSNKLENLRAQSDFHVKLFAYELLIIEGQREYQEKNYERACRKFEEALSIFRYFVSFNPKWQEQGIDDSEIKEIDEQGKNDFEKQELKRLKLSLYLNIAACNIKSKDYETAQAACNEALKLDPYNVKALYRRARAIALPINSGVEDFRAALVDLKRILEVIDPAYKPALKETKRLMQLIEVNRKREKDTYSKMFTSKEGIVKEGEIQAVPQVYKTTEDLEYERERQKMEARVKQQMQAKLQEFSFEVLPEEKRKHYREMEDLQEMVDKAEESYRLFRKTNRGKEAKVVKQKLEEALFAKEHLYHVMNLDFSKPTQKLKDMAAKNNIDLRDPMVIEEFRRIQQQNLEDIRRMKEGKKPLTDEEMKAKLHNMRENEQQEAEAKRLLEESQKKKDEGVKKLVENAMNSQLKATEPSTNDQYMHYLVVGGFFTVWLAFIIYMNFGLTEKTNTGNDGL